jgi:hypothetical protein
MARVENLLAKVAVARECWMNLVGPTSCGYVHFGKGAIMFLHEEIMLLKE